MKRISIYPIMLVLWVIAFVAFLYGCSVDHHLSKMKKHRSKAIEKGAKIQPDTLWKYVTTTDTLWKDGEIKEIRTTVTDSIPYPVEVLTYVHLSRQERKALKDSMNHIEKLYKLDLRALKDNNDKTIDSLNQVRRIEAKRLETELKIAKHESKASKFWTWIGKRWYFLLLVGLFIGVFVSVKFRKIRDKLKTYLWK